MKTVTLGRERGKVIWNTQFTDYAVDMSFVPRVYRGRAPQTKGKVERLVMCFPEYTPPEKRIRFFRTL